MVVFNIYYEPIKYFNQRISSPKNSISFSEILMSWNNKNTIEQLADKFSGKKECIFRMSDYSLSTQLVLENTNLLVTIFEKIGISNVMMHNPPKKLFNSLNEVLSNDCLNINNNCFKKITVSDIQRVNNDLEKNIIGQQKAKKRLLRKLVGQLVKPNSKPLVLMFYGEPGIGKTETAKSLSNSLFGTDTIVREQMSMAGGDNSVKYFKSTSHSEDSFSKTMLSRESNVILLDEFALAPSFFHSSFFQMFDEGIYEDQSYKVDVSNSIIICTCNYDSKAEMEKNINNALLTRFDGFIKFYPLTFNDKEIIVEKTFDSIINSDFMLEEYKKHLEIEEMTVQVIERIDDLPNVRSIRKYVEDVIADRLLNVILSSTNSPSSGNDLW